MLVRIYVNRTLVGKPSHEQRTTDGPIKIVVRADRKLRIFTHRSPQQDEWPILNRRDVPALTDEEWYSSPGPEWDLTEEYEQEQP